jgi:uncharacterized protein YndB with AHSA1/START domain
MNVSTGMTTNTADREIRATRVFAAPRELVFDAWTDGEHISRWWGPQGFTTTTLEMDVRPGGAWRFIMHGPDGRDYPNKIIYIDIARPERLVYRHAGEAGLEPVRFHTTVSFIERDGRTEVSVRMLFASASERNRVAKEYGAVEGLHQTLERLSNHLQDTQGESRGQIR